MKIKERLETWQANVTQLTNQQTELTERLDKIWDQLQDQPQLKRLQTDLETVRAELLQTTQNLSEAKAQLETLKQMPPPPPKSADDIQTPVTVQPAPPAKLTRAQTQRQKWL